MRSLLHCGRWTALPLSLVAILVSTQVHAADSYELIFDLGKGGTPGVEGGGERFEFGPQGSPIVESRTGCFQVDYGNGLECLLCPSSDVIRHEGTGAASVFPGDMQWSIDVTDRCQQGSETGLSVAYSRFDIDDLIFSGDCPGFISVSLNFDALREALGVSQLSVIAYNNGNFFWQNTNLTTGSHVTSSFSVATNTPWSIALVLQGSIRTQGLQTASLDAALSFTSATPVFNLPACATVNSEQAVIVDNIWNPPVATEPSSWGLIKARYGSGN